MCTLKRANSMKYNIRFVRHIIVMIKTKLKEIFRLLSRFMFGETPRQPIPRVTVVTTSDVRTIDVCYLLGEPVGVNCNILDTVKKRPQESVYRLYARSAGGVLIPAVRTV